ncbi:MAG TPA: UDP-N-acetylglucosamine 2-epimerase (non-hydrolyzing) [Kofleriaceae bacterium]|jgi:UDP-N-acetylglucosamine 2-epimerase (non-hydrolysing)|nr:UDP-N-acetylglucosamine 2-epimerase (non-hydrolyzing) [Kofleriaceae bacterium]
MRWRILCVAGARPNFMKIAPLLRAFADDPRFEAGLVHTGQHYDDRLSRVFFDELAIPRPDVDLEVGSGSHAQQTAEIMKRFEPVLEREQPHGVLVVGDVNSTIACAAVTAKFFRREPFRAFGRTRKRPLVIHVEAGLRSRDLDMPEEINRMLTDAISDLLFVSEPSGMVNLAREGVGPDRAVFVGNVMIDTLLAARERARSSPVLTTLGLGERAYGLVTLHRPSNVDDVDALQRLLATLAGLGVHLVFPVHPRTRHRMQSAGIALDPERWSVCEPLGYLDFLRLQASARVVFTDSGGIQEETTVLGVPCITLRESTERPVTCEQGTNQLAGTSPATIVAAYQRIDEIGRAGRVPERWDGKSAQRIAAAIADALA